MPRPLFDDSYTKGFGFGNGFGFGYGNGFGYAFSDGNGYGDGDGYEDVYEYLYVEDLVGAGLCQNAIDDFIQSFPDGRCSFQRE